MENLTVSKIHRISKVQEPLSDWLTAEKTLYEHKVQKGKVPENTDFDTWINKRYQPIIKQVMESKNASGFVEGLKNVVKKTAEKVTPDPVAQSASPIITIEKTIFGLKPVVFWSVAGSVLLLTGILVYKKVKSK